MSPEEIAAAMLRQPFVPLRITLSEEPRRCERVKKVSGTVS
jgi:hypothetical protein